jgi:hypothetical protein
MVKGVKAYVLAVRELIYPEIVGHENSRESDTES